jgi:hypothetical protein
MRRPPRPRAPISENELIAPFAGMRIHEETERAPSLLALVDAAARKRFRARAAPSGNGSARDGSRNHKDQ